MTDYPYLPPKCRTGRCDHAPDRCMHYRSRRCLSGECTHGSQNLLCAVNYPTQSSEPSPCPAVYPHDRAGYLGRPRCGFSADHREAVVGDTTDHVDHRGFRWPAKAAS